MNSPSARLRTTPPASLQPNAGGNRVPITRSSKTSLGTALTSAFGLNGFANAREANEYGGNPLLKLLDQTGRTVDATQVTAAKLRGDSNAIAADQNGGDYQTVSFPGVPALAGISTPVLVVGALGLGLVFFTLIK